MEQTHKNITLLIHYRLSVKLRISSVLNHGARRGEQSEKVGEAVLDLGVPIKLNARISARAYTHTHTDTHTSRHMHTDQGWITLVYNVHAVKLMLTMGSVYKNGQRVVEATLNGRKFRNVVIS